MFHESTFEYLEPTPTQQIAMAKVRTATKAYAEAIVANVPEGADRTYLLRKIRECGMWANVAITREADGTPRLESAHELLKTIMLEAAELYASTAKAPKEIYCTPAVAAALTMAIAGTNAPLSGVALKEISIPGVGSVKVKVAPPEYRFAYSLTGGQGFEFLYGDSNL